MSLSNYAHAKSLLSQFLDQDMAATPDEDQKFVHEVCSKLDAAQLTHIQNDFKQLIQDANFAVEDVGTESNRWFGSSDEAISWFNVLLEGVDGCMAAGSGGSSGVNQIVKDSNGATLSEGDSVTVIKDLKVKGGSSDLKRGTLIHKIRLTDDPKLIECRVGGSVLVLKTEFLKKVSGEA